jgi:hypothetical protein
VKLYCKILAISLLVFHISCKNSTLTLKKISLPADSEVDTLEMNKLQDLCILGVTENKWFDSFDYYYAVSRISTNTRASVYRVLENGNSQRISKDYIAIVEKDESSWGWFNIINGRRVDSLPRGSKILDSLKSVYPRDLFIQEANGYFLIRKQGKVVTSLDYGNLILGNHEVKFDSLNYGLYKLSSNGIEVVSNNGNDLEYQKNGVFFVPLPGYGSIQKFSKQEIYRKVDSVYTLGDLPDKIEVSSIR